jgi:DNA polymerase elongation subunit (family B)
MKKNRKPKIVFWDIETSGIVATTWNLYPESISHENMIQDWFMLCVAWKELGGKMQTVSLLDDKKRFKKDCTDDYHVVKTIRDALEDVDILVHQNGDRFDMRMLTTRLMYHNLPPLPKLQTIDTLKEIKRVSRNTSNRLDYIGKWLLGVGKMETPKGTWLKAMNGDEKALKLMLSYNVKDVELLERVYHRTKKYYKTSPHLGALMGKDKNHSCPKCGSTHFDPSHNKIRYTASGNKKIQRQCSKCHSYHTFNITK